MVEKKKFLWAIAPIVLAISITFVPHIFADEDAVKTFKDYFSDKKNVSTPEEYANFVKKYRTQRTIEDIKKAYAEDERIRNFFDIKELEIESVEEKGGEARVYYHRKNDGNFWGAVRLVKEDSAWKVRTDFSTTQYIPKDIEECFSELKKVMAAKDLEEFKKVEEEKVGGRYHFGWGAWMRNNWGLWAGSRLAKYFNAMEVYHPDDMSGIILTSFHRYLNNKDIGLNEQVRYYKDYWKKVKQKEIKEKNNLEVR